MNLEPKKNSMKVKVQVFDLGRGLDLCEPEIDLGQVSGP